MDDIEYWFAQSTQFRWIKQLREKTLDAECLHTWGDLGGMAVVSVEYAPIPSVLLPRIQQWGSIAALEDPLIRGIPLHSYGCNLTDTDAVDQSSPGIVAAQADYVVFCPSKQRLLWECTRKTCSGMLSHTIPSLKIEKQRGSES